MSTSRDLPGSQPATDESLPDQFRALARLADQAVARVTDAEVEGQLRRVLHAAADRPAPGRTCRKAPVLRPGERPDGAHQRAGGSPAAGTGRGTASAAGMAVLERERDEPTVLGIVLGSPFRRLRQARGITPLEASRHIRGSATRIALLEHGRDRLGDPDLADLLTACGVSDAGEREQMMSLASQSGQSGWWHRYQDILPGWFQAYVGLEESAEVIRSYDAQFVPGLLQTDDYASAAISLGPSPASDTRRLVALRRERQHRQASGGLQLHVVIDELALRRPIGGPGVMRGQLEHLIRITGQRGITVQVSMFPGHYSVPGQLHHPALPQRRPSRHRLHRAADQLAVPRQGIRRRHVRQGHERPHRPGPFPRTVRRIPPPPGGRHQLTLRWPGRAHRSTRHHLARQARAGATSPEFTSISGVTSSLTRNPASIADWTLGSTDPASRSSM